MNTDMNFYRIKEGVTIENINFAAAPDEVRLFLCKPNRETVCELYQVKDRKLQENYGGVNVLEFTVPYIVSAENGNSTRNPLVELIRGGYLVKYEKGITQDFYIIANPTNEAFDDGKEELRVVCHQLQYEWIDKLVRNFKGTLPLYDPVGDNGVLNQTLLRKTDWSMGYVDSSLFTPVHKHRTFDESERNMLEFIFDAIDSYGSYIPIFDTVNKKLSIYLDENYGRNEGLTVEYGKYLKSISEEENFDDVITRLYIYGKDNLSINRINPSGTDYIESFDFYMHGFEQDANGHVIRHSPYMSDALCKAIIQYNQLLEDKGSQFQQLIAQKEAYQTTLTQLENELTKLNDEMRMLQDEKDTLIGTGGNVSNVNQRISTKQNQLNNKQAEIDGVKASIANLDTQIASLRTEISIEHNFTPELIKERNLFIKEKSWRDNNYTRAEDLYQQGKEYLLQWSQPQVVYQLNAVDFLNALNTSHDWNKLKIGSLVTIVYPQFNIRIEAKIIVIDHDLDQNTLKLTIANTRDIKSGFLKIKDLLNRSVNTSTQVDMSKFKWDLSEENHTEINQLLNNAWDANKRAIEAGNNLNYLLNERGLTLKDPKDQLKYLRAVHNFIAITNDGGNTFKNALTWQGVVAERLYGVVLAGANLTIQNTSGTFLVDGNGVTIKDMNTTITRSDQRSRILLNATDGVKIQSSTNGTTWVDKLYADTSGNLNMNGYLTVGSGSSVFTANQYGIALGSNIWSSAPFRVDLNGNATLNKLTANSAVIRDSQFNNGAIVGSSINVNNRFMVDANGNVTMTSGIISWGGVSAPDYSQILGIKPPSNADNTSLNLPGALGSYYTKIGSTYIYTGTLNANQINAGTISANFIRGGVLSGVIVDVDTDVKVGRSLTFQGAGNKNIVFGGSGSITFYDLMGAEFAANGTLTLRSRRIQFTGDEVRINNDLIATQEWVRVNAVARFA